MRSMQRCKSLFFSAISRNGSVVAGVLTFLTMMIVAALSIQAQQYHVLHYLGYSPGDGMYPSAGLAMDQDGNLYGTTLEGGNSAGPCFDEGCGTVFTLTRGSSGWVFHTIYSFTGGTDGMSPWGGVTVGADGSLYGTTYAGGSDLTCPISGSRGCGAVFKLTSPGHIPPGAVQSWSETVLYRFKGGSDGLAPLGSLALDQAGNIYGATYWAGVVFKLSQSQNGWTESVLANRVACLGGVALDHAGNVYGASTPSGEIFEVTPNPDGTWTKRTLHILSGDDGSYPYGGLMVDDLGNVYGTTSSGGSANGGTAFELRPGSTNWIFTLLYSFSGSSSSGPYASLSMDAAGSLYGTTYEEGAYQGGNVFKLTPTNGGWTYTSLHDFVNGAAPQSNVVFDSEGNLYGTTTYEGQGGSVWQITP
jgi:uncharacterized repeat protein (TIGR03803 family)